MVVKWIPTPCFWGRKHHPFCQITWAVPLHPPKCKGRILNLMHSPIPKASSPICALKHWEIRLSLAKLTRLQRSFLTMFHLHKINLNQSRPTYNKLNMKSATEKSGPEKEESWQDNVLNLRLSDSRLITEVINIPVGGYSKIFPNTFVPLVRFFRLQLHAELTNKQTNIYLPPKGHRRSLQNPDTKPALENFPHATTRLRPRRTKSGLRSSPAEILYSLEPRLAVTAPPQPLSSPHAWGSAWRAARPLPAGRRAGRSAAARPLRKPAPTAADGGWGVSHGGWSFPGTGQGKDAWRASSATA